MKDVIPTDKLGEIKKLHNIMDQHEYDASQNLFAAEEEKKKIPQQNFLMGLEKWTL